MTNTTHKGRLFIASLIIINVVVPSIMFFTTMNFTLFATLNAGSTDLKGVEQLIIQLIYIAAAVLGGNFILFTLHKWRHKGHPFKRKKTIGELMKEEQNNQML